MKSNFYTSFTQSLAVLAICPALLMFTSCGRHTNSEVFYLVSANLSLPYWKTAVAGFNAAAVRYKVTAKVAGPDSFDANAELQQLNQVIAAKPAGILISVTDEQLLKPGIDAAVAAGIPVITIDSDAASSHRLFFHRNEQFGGRAPGRGTSG